MNKKLLNSIIAVILIIFIGWIGYILGTSHPAKERRIPRYGLLSKSAPNDIHPTSGSPHTIYQGIRDRVNSQVERSYGVQSHTYPRSIVPIPRGALKETSEDYRTPFYTARKPLAGTDYFRPYGPNSPTSNIVASDIPFYNRGSIPGSSHTVASANAFAPFPEVASNWEKVGILTQNIHDTSMSHRGPEILNLYRRPIAPQQDLWQYSAQDKDGFILLLRNEKNLLEDGDVIKNIPGKVGSYTFSDFVQHKYIYV